MLLVETILSPSSDTPQIDPRLKSDFEYKLMDRKLHFRRLQEETLLFRNC